MTLRIAAYENGDHACILWFPDDLKPIVNCRGFAIQRETTRPGSEPSHCYINNFVDFGGYNATPLPAGDEWKRPFQRYLWWDYSVKVGDQVRYRVVPVVGPDKNSLQPDPANGSAITSPLLITGQATPHMSAFFNKGIIAAQWVARELAQKAKTGEARRKTMQRVINTLGDPLRDALSGLLRTAIVKQLDDTEASGGVIYAALYELNDPELIATLEKFGDRCNLILGNGAFKPPANDENATIRKTLKAESKIKVHDRLVTSGHFAHNKFVVFCDPDGTPRKVLTGSTNWTVTGLCTQANNGLLIDDQGVAQAFRYQWDRILEAGNTFPAELIAANSERKNFTVDNASVTTWFAPTGSQQDMIEARQLIDQAKDGGLFLFFNPGQFADDEDKATLLQALTERLQPGKPNYKQDLYLRGVVNQKIAKLTDDENQQAEPPSDEVTGGDPHDPGAPNSPVLLYGEHQATPVRAPKSVLLPAAIKTKFAGWGEELLSMGVMVHSKVIVLDPFGDNPVVMTGSHNLGTKASRANDDNLVIIQGTSARTLAISYALNIIAIYQEYRWRTYVATHQGQKQAWPGLQDSDQWQAGHLQGDKQDLDFWLKGIDTSTQTNAEADALPAAPAAAEVVQLPVKPTPGPRPKAPSGRTAARKAA